MESTSEKRKRLASQVLEELLKSSYQETLKLCEDLGYKVEDLSPSSKEDFREKGVTVDLVSIRFNHHEERRVAKILKIASEIVKTGEASQALRSLMKQSDNSKLSHQNSIKSVRSESFSFTRPQDYINYGLEREKDKFNKSLRTMERISVIREAAKTQADMKRQKFEQQTRVISQNRSRKSEEFQKVVDNKVEHRKRILEKKYENRKKIDLEMLDYGNHLEKRMNKLSAWQKTEIRKKLKSKLEKFKQRMEEKQNRRSNEDKMDKEYDILAEKLLNEIKEKIDKRVNEYISLIGTRVQSARDHSLKVGHTFEKSIKIEGYHQRESLRKNVNKSLISSKKLKQKSLMASESSEKLKKTMYESFQKNRRGLSEISVEESRRLDKIEDRFKKKEEIFKGIRNSIKSKYEEKKQRNFMRTEKHFRNYIERQREEIMRKQKVMDKHRHLSQVANELSKYKNEVSYNKRKSNLEIQRIRSSRVSPNARQALMTPRRFELTF